MLKSKLQFQNKSGFTLIELVLGLAITSILIITLYNCLSFVLTTSQKGIEEDQILLNGRYILEYIKEDIGSADKIITSSNFEGLNSTFPTNIGFVILNLKKDRDEKTGKLQDAVTYSYTTYYFKNDSIVRINTKKLIHKDIITDTQIFKNKLPKASEFSGYNAIGYDLSSESKISLNKRNIISLDLSFKNNKSQISNFKSDVFIRCEVVKWYESKI